jgi:hypothetical protein
LIDRRRFLLTWLVGAPAAPCAIEGQQVGKVFTIGVLTSAASRVRHPGHRTVDLLGYAFRFVDVDW